MNRRYLAIALRVVAIVLLGLAAFRLAVGLRSSVEIDETMQNGGFGTSQSFAIDHVTMILGLIGVAMFWCSFVAPRNRANGSNRKT